MTDLSALTALYALVQDSAVVVAPLRSGLLKAITAPAQRVGLNVDERLAEALATIS